MSKEAMTLALEALYLAVRIEPSDSIHECPEMFQGAIKALRNALAKQEQGEPVAWEPIETAPKDGSMILICLPRQMNIVIRAWYNKIHNFWQTDYEGEGGITRPTYFHEGDLWHPIPSLYTKPQPAQKPLTDEQTEKAAIKLAECMDYPWTHMPEEGKREMRKHVKAVIEAAHGIKE